jgi:hypothetical protein
MGLQRSMVPTGWHAAYRENPRWTRTEEDLMIRDNVTRKILAIKRARQPTWKWIVREIGGGSTVYPKIPPI